MNHQLDETIYTWTNDRYSEPSRPKWQDLLYFQSKNTSTPSYNGKINYPHPSLFDLPLLSTTKRTVNNPTEQSNEKPKNLVIAIPEQLPFYEEFKNAALESGNIVTTAITPESDWVFHDHRYDVRASPNWDEVGNKEIQFVNEFYFRQIFDLKINFPIPDFLHYHLVYIVPHSLESKLKSIVIAGRGRVTDNSSKATIIVSIKPPKNLLSQQQWLLPEELVHLSYTKEISILQMLFELGAYSPSLSERKWAIQRLISRNEMGTEEVIRWLLKHGHGGLVCWLYRSLSEQKDSRFIDIAIQQIQDSDFENRDSRVGVKNFARYYLGSLGEIITDLLPETIRELMESIPKPDPIQDPDFVNWREELIKFIEKEPLAWQILNFTITELPLDQQIRVGKELTKFSIRTMMRQYLRDFESIRPGRLRRQLIRMGITNLKELAEVDELAKAHTFVQELKKRANMNFHLLSFKRMIKQTSLVHSPAVFALGYIESEGAISVSPSSKRKVGRWKYIKNFCKGYLASLPSVSPDRYADYATAVFLFKINKQTFHELFASLGIEFWEEYPEQIWTILKFPDAQFDECLNFCFKIFERPIGKTFIDNLNLEEVLKLPTMTDAVGLEWLASKIKVRIETQPFDQKICVNLISREEESIALIGIQWMGTEWPLDLAALAGIHLNEIVYKTAQTYILSRSTSEASQIVLKMLFILSEMKEFDKKKFSRFFSFLKEVPIDSNEEQQFQLLSIAEKLVDAEYKGLSVYLPMLIGEEHFAKVLEKAANSSFEEIRKRAENILYSRSESGEIENQLPIISLMWSTDEEISNRAQNYVQVLFDEQKFTKEMLTHLLLTTVRLETPENLVIWLLDLLNRLKPELWQEIPPSVLWKFSQHPVSELATFGILQFFVLGDKLPEPELLQTIANSDETSLRQKVLKLLESKLSLLGEAPRVLLPLLESSFPDLHEGAKQLFKKCPAPVKARSTAAEIFADSPIEKAQKFGLEQLNQLFAEGLPEETLLRLLEHPNSTIQQAISSQLEKLVDRALSINSLPTLNLFIRYAKVVLFAPNRLTDAKNYVTDLLKQIISSKTDSAPIARELLWEMTNSRIIRDRERAFLILAQLEEES
jgi:hypothetical protein